MSKLSQIKTGDKYTVEPNSWNEGYKKKIDRKSLKRQSKTKVSNGKEEGIPESDKSINVPESYSVNKTDSLDSDDDLQPPTKLKKLKTRNLEENNKVKENEDLEVITKNKTDVHLVPVEKMNELPSIKSPTKSNIINFNEKNNKISEIDCCKNNETAEPCSENKLRNVTADKSLKLSNKSKENKSENSQKIDKEDINDDLKAYSEKKPDHISTSDVSAKPKKRKLENSEEKDIKRQRTEEEINPFTIQGDYEGKIEYLHCDFSILVAKEFEEFGSGIDPLYTIDMDNNEERVPFEGKKVCFFFILFIFYDVSNFECI